MDISQFSKCLKELIEENDKVEVPHLGTFSASYVPASFSDKHTTINPPTREMSFVREDIEPRTGNIFVSKIMQVLELSEQQAAVELGWCLSRIISELEGARVCSFPGLGKMKANARRDFFFVPDADIDIYPEGLGFEAINIKAFEAELGTQKLQFVPKMTENPEAGTNGPDFVPKTAENPEAGTNGPDFVPKTAESPEAGTKEPDFVPKTAENPEAGTNGPDFVPKTAESPEAGTKEPDFVPKTAENPEAGTNGPDFVPEPEPKPEPKPTPEPIPTPSRKPIVPAIWLLIAAATIVVAVVALYLLRDTPFVSNLLDKILYTNEELQLLGR